MLSGLVWLQTVYRGHQQTTLVGKEFKNLLSCSITIFIQKDKQVHLFGQAKCDHLMSCAHIKCSFGIANCVNPDQTAHSGSD